MKRLLLVILVLGLEVGCAGSPVTDIGNPAGNVPVPAAVPAFGQLVGAYAVPAPTSSSPAPGGGGDNPDVQSNAVCDSDATKPHSIALGANPTDIILTNYFSYGSETDQIHAVYNTGTGAISFQVSGHSVTMSCSGKATLASGDVTVSLTCQQTQPKDGVCSISYAKKS